MAFEKRIFVFNMKTKDGYPFEAKPMGDRALKK